MPLPDAPPPKKSSLYNQLNTKVILPPQDNFLTDTRPDNILTQAQFQTLKAPVHIEGSKEDELRRLNLIGTTANQASNSGPFRIIRAQATLTGTGYAKLQPDLPGIYQLVGLDAVVTGGSGDQKYVFFYGSVDDGVACRWYYSVSDDSNVIFSADANYPDFPMFYSDEWWLVCQLSDVGSGITDVTFRAMFAQWR